MNTAVTNLRVNSMECPRAIEPGKPRFSWQMESTRTGAAQSAWQIAVRSGDELYWDSGRKEGADSLSIPYPAAARPLAPEKDYAWELTVWDETGTPVHASSRFSTGLALSGEDPWHGAAWIGTKELSLAAETLPVFKLSFTLQVTEGTEAGIVFGANDPRLSVSTQNNWLISGENWIQLRLDISRMPARILGFRKGYQPGENGTEPFAVMELPESVISAANCHDPHAFAISVSGNQIDLMTVDGTAVETDEENRRIVSSPLHPVDENTHLVLNPLKAVLDVPTFPRLCSVGFMTAAGTKAVFTDFQIRHYGGEQNVLFGPEEGAGYEIFSDFEGVSVEGARITLEPDTLVYADPSFGAVPMLRKRFTLREKPVRAFVYAGARGIFELSVNGKKAGDEYLSCGDMDFRRVIYYEGFDVTDMVDAGDNCLGAVIASGWYSDEASYTLDDYNFYGDKQAFLAVLSVTYADGSKEYIPTDSSWQCFTDGPVRYAANFNGETYDATKDAAVCGWNTADFTSFWRNAALMGDEVCGCRPVIAAKPDPGITAREEFTAAYIGSQTRGEDGAVVYLYDMGVNMTGIPKISFPEGRPGQKVTIRYAEMLYPDLPKDNPYCYGELGGMILTENLRSALVTDRYTLKGEPGETFMPVFTFHGYRYVEISGTDGPIPAECVRGITISSVRQTAHYESSSPLTNQLFKNISRSTISNHISIPTDCPQRDERLGWSGDAQVYSETATYMADVSAFYPYYCDLERQAQGPDGTYHLYAPSYAPIGVAFALGYTWNAVGVVIPWQTYRQYGDEQVLRDNYPAIRSHICGMMEQKPEGRQYLTGHIGFLGDHLAVKDTDPALMDNAQWYRSVCIGARIARILGKKQDAADFEAYAEGLKREWNEVFVGADHRTYSADGVLQDTQSSYSLPLACGVFSDENRLYAGRFLQEACEKTGYTMTTGFMGTGPLLPALTEAGHPDAAYALFEQKAYPSWLYPVLNGATTVWERWSSFTIENGFGGQNGMNSFNHYSLGAVASWMLEYQAGIQRGETAGFREFLLQPTPGGSFTHLKAAYDSAMGTIESEWEAEGGKLTSYRAVVPANTTAVLCLPLDPEKPVCPALPAGASLIEMTERFGRPCAKIALSSGSFSFAFA